MNRRVGVRAVRDTGSTTGVATAVLALLSAGTLATLGMVTAGELRDIGPGRPEVRRQDAIQPPRAVQVTEPPSTLSPGTPAGPAPGSGGRGAPTPPASFPLPAALPPDLGGAGLATAGPGTVAGEPAVPEPAVPEPAVAVPAVPVPTPIPVPTGPVFAAVPDPVPTSEASALDAKHDRALGRDKVKPAKHDKPKKSKEDEPAPTVAAVTSSVPAQTVGSPSVAPAEEPDRRPGQGHERGQGRGHDKHEGDLPTAGGPSVAPILPPVVAVPVVGADDEHGDEHDDEHGDEHGNGHGRDKH